MSSPSDTSSGGLFPISEKRGPLASVQQMLAIDTVYLSVGEAAPRTLRDFYTHVLGLEAVTLDSKTLEFRHGRRRVVLGPPVPGVTFTKLALAVTNFSLLLQGLSSQRTAYELMHFDGGLSRAVLLQDPAGNWIHLLETRPF